MSAPLTVNSSSTKHSKNDLTNISDELSILITLKPLLRLAQVFGVCPQEFHDKNMKSSKRLMVIHTIITMVLLWFYFGFQVFQLVSSLLAKKSILTIMSQLCWTGAVLLPLVICTCTFSKEESFTSLHEDVKLTKEVLGHLLDYKKSRLVIQRLCIFHSITGIISMACIAHHSLTFPHNEVYILYYFEKEVHISWILLNTLFHQYIVIVKWFGTAFTEVILCGLAFCFHNVIDKIENEMKLNTSPNILRLTGMSLDFNVTKNSNEKQFEQLYNFEDESDVKCDNRSMTMMMNHSNNSIQESISISPTSNEQFDGFKRTRTISKDPAASNDCSENNDVEDELSSDQIIILENISLAIKRFHTISYVQTSINQLFGFILALDISYLVVMSCLLIYLPIKYLNEVHSEEGIVYFGNAIIYMCRLVALVLCLSKVHQRSVIFNTNVRSILIHLKKTSNSTANYTNSILIHLNKYSGNPLGFSGGSYFLISRSTLLAVLSVITTYLVILLQANNEAFILKNCTAIVLNDDDSRRMLLQSNYTIH